jgi:hypothetical protein
MNVLLADLQSGGYRGAISSELNRPRRENLTLQFHIVASSIIRGVMTPLPYTAALLLIRLRQNRVLSQLVNGKIICKGDNEVRW